MKTGGNKYCLDTKVFSPANKQFGNKILIQINFLKIDFSFRKYNNIDSINLIAETVIKCYWSAILLITHNTEQVATIFH